jgi:hypothetical protein
MRHNTIFIALISLLFLLNSCASAKQKGWLSAHRNRLTESAESPTLSAEEKVDVLLTTYAVLMDEGLRFVNPAKGIRYIRHFHTQNEANIGKILAQSGTWMEQLDTRQSIGLGLRLIQKPYIGRFIDLYPKFKRKYETYKFIMDMSGKVAGAFGQVGRKVLGN